MTTGGDMTDKAERNAVIAARYSAGEHCQLIANDYEISAKRVYQIARRAGEPRRNHHFQRFTVACQKCGCMIENVVRSVALTRKYCSRQCAASARGGRPREYTDEQLLAHLRSIANTTGRTPSQRDIAAASPPAHGAYYRYFGSLRRAQELAGLEPNRRGRK